MITTAKDVFATLYEAFRKLDKVSGPDAFDMKAGTAAKEVYEERVRAADKEVETILEEGARVLDRYIENRIKRTIAKLKYDGELK